MVDEIMTRLDGLTTSPCTNEVDKGSEEMWKKILAEKDSELRALQKEHDEYVASSCEIERELENEVTNLEENQSKLLEQLRKALDEQQVAKSTVDVVNKELSKLQSIVAELMETNVAYKSDIQRLEQRNDDLERLERELHATIDDMEHQLETSVEQNVFLRQENDDLISRLHDERSIVHNGLATVNPLSMESQLKYGTDSKLNVRSPPMSPKSTSTRRSSFIQAVHGTQCGPNCSVM